jgi:hypothetical protein
MPDLWSASRFIETHGAWAFFTICLMGALVWTFKKMVEIQDKRISDAKESLPLLEKVSLALDTQTRVIENFIQEMRSKK